MWDDLMVIPLFIYTFVPDYQIIILNEGICNIRS